MAIDTIQQIITAVCEKTGVKREEIFALSRKRRVVRPRQMAMSLAREFTRFSLPQLGTKFCRDHTTVLTGVRKIAELEQRYPGMAQQMADLRRQLRGEVTPEVPAPIPDPEDIIRLHWSETAKHTRVDGSVHG